MAYDLADYYSSALVLVESSGVVHFDSNENLTVKDVPWYARYNRTNLFTRVFSMLGYFIYVLAKVLFYSPKSLLFLVTTPPFLGLIGYIFKKIRKQQYVMLVYDILPGALIGAGFIKDGFASRFWDRINRIILNNADAVITIGEYMAANLTKKFDVSKTKLGYIAVTHNWADVEVIKPLPKENNSFIEKYGLRDNFIVMYSGNIGATHDMKTLIETVVKLKNISDIKFIIIGEGAQKQYILNSKEKYGLDNMLIMDYLPQDQLPSSLSAADISIVTIANGVQGYLVPCKFYSYLAAGSAVISICKAKCEIADIINSERCGKVVSPGDSEALIEAINEYYEKPGMLQQAKANSRSAAVQKYSRANTQSYIDVIEKIYFG